MFKALTPFLSIITAVVVGFFAIKPMYEDIKSIQAETAQYREAVEKSTVSNNKLQELLQQKNSFSAGELERIDAIAPDSINAVKLLVDLETLGKQHNVLIGNFDAGGSEVNAGSAQSGSVDAGGGVSDDISFEDDFITKDISFSLIGTYDQFRSVLTDLERSLTIFEIINLSFSVLEGDLQQYDLTVRAYALRGSSVQ